LAQGIFKQSKLDKTIMEIAGRADEKAVEQPKFTKKRGSE